MFDAIICSPQDHGCSSSRLSLCVIDTVRLRASLTVRQFSKSSQEELKLDQGKGKCANWIMPQNMGWVKRTAGLSDKRTHDNTT